MKILITGTTFIGPVVVRQLWQCSIKCRLSPGTISVNLPASVNRILRFELRSALIVTH